MRIYFLKTIFLFLTIAFTSCSSNVTTTNSGAQNSDSLLIDMLVRKMYRWHDSLSTKQIDFPLVVQDTLQVGVDKKAFNQALSSLKATAFFTDNFLNNYSNIADLVDKKLRTDTIKYFNEINFQFQEADPWTYFQDDAGKYWDSLIISDLAINGGSASLYWHLGGQYPTLNYKVKLKQTDNSWRIDYLKGFDNPF